METIGGVGVPPNTMDAEQPDFFMLSRAEDGEQARKLGAVPRGKGVAGRPLGAKNKSTEAWREYLLSRYVSPLIGMAEIAGRPPGDLARELGCPVVEAFKLQIVCLRELAPYLHSKMPIALDAGPNGLIQLAIHGFNQPQQNQGVRVLPSEMLDNNLSDETQRALILSTQSEFKPTDAVSDAFGGAA